jgi:tripartite-type tricarboxylate transporter receptor subunit TctC
MGKHIPGEPGIIVQNLPGAGGMVVTNQLVNQGPHDGTAIGAPLNGIPTAPMLQGGAKFDAAKLQWIGSANREAYVAYVWHTAPITKITELADKEVLVGATTAGATMVDYPLLMNDLLGYKFKVVRGYKGPPEINLAMERGEVQGNGGLGYAVVQALTQKWLDEKKIRILVQYNFQRLPELKGVPLVTELAKDESQRQAMRLVFARAEYSRPFFVSPETPKDRVTALRRALDATMKDLGLPRGCEETAARHCADVGRGDAGAGRGPGENAARCCGARQGGAERKIGTRVARRSRLHGPSHAAGTSPPRQRCCLKTLHLRPFEPISRRLSDGSRIC